MGVSGKVFALTFCGLLSLGIALRETYEGWQVLRVQPKTQEQLRLLHRMYLQNNQVDFWKSARHLGESAEILVPPKSLKETKSYLQHAGIHVATLHEDISSLVRPEIERIERKSRIGPVKGAAFDYDEFHTYEEVMAEMEDMVTRCPAGFNCETYIIGQSWEGRDQKILKIHKQGQTRPIHWIDTITHAREWLGLAVHLKFVNYLFSNYETDADAKMFLDAGDWYFMFILNPDGYEFTWTDRRLWRKCRFNNSLLREDTDCFGVDLNRNFMHRWGNAGSTLDPCSDLYRGESPASSIETKNVQNEVLKMKGRLRMFMSIHTAANLILNVWGSVVDPGVEEICEKLDEPKFTQQEELSRRMAKAIENTFGHTTWDGGNVCEYIYPASGSTMEFATALAGADFGFGPELRDRNGTGFPYSFIAPPSEIQPAFEETFNGLKEMMIGMKEVEEQNPPLTCGVNRITIVNSYFSLIVALLLCIVWKI